MLAAVAARTSVPVSRLLATRCLLAPGVVGFSRASFATAAAEPVPLAADPDAAAPSAESDANRKVHFRASPIPHPLYSKPARLQTTTTTTTQQQPELVWDNPIHHEIWTQEEVQSVQPTHVEPADTTDRIAYAGVRLLRVGFDVFSGYIFGDITTNKLLRRIVFLETVAGIPGMVAGAIRHLRSLRLMRRDHGWIHSLLEEAENERMHLLIFKDIQRPSLLLRGMVLVSQGIFWNTFFLSYLFSPRLCHRFVGYIEEEAVKTYSKAIEAYDAGKLPELANLEVPPIARAYWRLQPTATMRDVLLAVRADEANHRDVNHIFSGLQVGDINPFVLKRHE